MKKLLKSFVGKNLKISLDKNTKLMVYVGKSTKPIIFCAGDKGIEIIIDNRIAGVMITPYQGVKCIEASYTKNKYREYLWFKLGRNRFLTATYLNDEIGKELGIAYMPDESDLENDKSDFLKKCTGRGLL